MIAREQMAEIAESVGDHIENTARGGLRYFLCHAGDDHAALYPYFTIVGMQFAGDQFHQGGFAFAVATDDAHALVRLDREVDMFEQEGAADAEVDALKLDQGHPVILAAGVPKAANRELV
ncbi:hypothetical protein GCM10010872_21790 [Dyella flava]|nr:hypothetical protein GCM10010872_21790 [Dyella flava]